MTEISRRRFLTALGTTVGAVTVGGLTLTVWRHGDSSSSGPTPTTGSGGTSPTSAPAGDTTGTAAAPGTTSSGATAPARTLVVVELAGGNDGLNTVVPLDDPRYHQLRPTLGITDALALDSSIGLSPQLAKLADRYRAGHVAIVEGVGAAVPNLSHFASMATWWSGDPASEDGTGWLGRYLDRTVGADDPLAAISLGTIPSPALIGARSFSTSIVDAGGLQPTLPRWVGDRDALLGTWARFAGSAGATSATLLDRVERAIGLTVEARNGLTTVLDASAADPTTAPGDGVDETTSAANDPVVASFRLAARLVLAPSPPRVVYVTGLGDYDTHEGLLDRHAALMTSLDAGIEAFFAALDAGGGGERAVVMTTSEFGRRPAENGSGTDHGTAAPHFLVGPAVKGGRYGEPPSLGDLDEHGNLRHTVDLRAYYATALHGWLGVDPGPVIGDGQSPLDVFA